MKRLWMFVILNFCLATYAQGQCEKCDLEKVKAVDQHLHELTVPLVGDFLCTFDKSCRNNVEYSEWSNEVLFKILDTGPALFFRALSNRHIDIDILLTEIRNPIHDNINLQEIYDKVKAAPGKKRIKQKFLSALVSSAKNSGQQLNK